MSRSKQRRRSGDTEVVIRLDEKFFYGLLVLVGIVAVFGIGLWYGARSSPAATSAPQTQQRQVTNQTQPAVPGNNANPQISGGGQNDQIQRLSIPRIGSPPLRAEEVEGDAPHVVIPSLSEDNNFDLGNMFADQVASETLTVRNPGKSDLTIDDVQGSKGLEVKTDTKTVGPGEEATLTLSYDPQETGAEGLTLGYILIASNDPDVPVAQFTVTAYVIKRPPSSSSSSGE